MDENSPWTLEAFVEYDDTQGYLGASPSAAPFEAFGGEVIPMHRVPALRQGAAPEFVELLVTASEGSRRGLPEGVSGEIGQALEGELSAELGSVTGWMDGAQLHAALQGRDTTSWGIGVYLLTETIIFLGGELGPENVRLIFRATPRTS